MRCAPLTYGSLFSGIGGLDLGFERATGATCRWQVELDPWCRKVLAKHWPQAVRHEDVRAVGTHNLERVDAIIGGFPCTDISNAGNRAGLDGEESGLWREYARILRELRPEYAYIENVAALLARGMVDVLGDLAALGYDAEWRTIRASDVGAPHQRDRIFILAYANGDGLEGERLGELLDRERASQRDDVDGRGGAPVGDANGSRRRWRAEAAGGNRGEAAADRRRVCVSEGPGQWPPRPDDLHAWGRVPAHSQPSFCRMADGLPAGLVRDRRPKLKALGNAVVPAQAQAAWEDLFGRIE